jgi:hypothetical protein
VAAVHASLPKSFYVAKRRINKGISVVTYINSQDSNQVSVTPRNVSSSTYLAVTGVVQGTSHDGAILCWRTMNRERSVTRKGSVFGPFHMNFHVLFYCVELAPKVCTDLSDTLCTKKDCQIYLRFISRHCQ